MGRLKASVVVNGVVYTEGSEPADDVVAQITNPDAWEDRPTPAEPDARQEPPRAGAGSTTDAWRAYAAAVGVTVADDAGRDDIIAAVDAAQS